MILLFKIVVTTIIFTNVIIVTIIISNIIIQISFRGIFWEKYSLQSKWSAEKNINKKILIKNINKNIY